MRPTSKHSCLQGNCLLTVKSCIKAAASMIFFVKFCRLLQLRSVKSNPECTFGTLEFPEVVLMWLDVHMYKHNDVIATGTGRQFCTVGRISSSTAVYEKGFYLLIC